MPQELSSIELTSVELTRQTAQLISIGTFGLVLLVFVIISVILNYHWTHYGISLGQIGRVRVIYFGVSSILFVGMFVVFLMI